MSFILIGLFVIFTLLIVGYCKSPTANAYFKAVWIFLVVAAAGLLGAMVDQLFGPADLSVVFAIAAATIFITLKPNEK